MFPLSTATDNIKKKTDTWPIVIISKSQGHKEEPSQPHRSDTELNSGKKWLQQEEKSYVYRQLYFFFFWWGGGGVSSDPRADRYVTPGCSVRHLTWRYCGTKVVSNKNNTNQIPSSHSERQKLSFEDSSPKEK